MSDLQRAPEAGKAYEGLSEVRLSARAGKTIVSGREIPR